MNLLYVLCINTVNFSPIQQQRHLSIGLIVCIFRWGQPIFWSNLSHMNTTMWLLDSIAVFSTQRILFCVTLSPWCSSLIWWWYLTLGTSACVSMERETIRKLLAIATSVVMRSNKINCLPQQYKCCYLFQSHYVTCNLTIKTAEAQTWTISSFTNIPSSSVEGLGSTLTWETD